MLKVSRARRNVIKSEIIMKVLISTKLVTKVLDAQASFKIFLTYSSTSLFQIHFRKAATNSSKMTKTTPRGQKLVAAEVYYCS